MDHSTFDAPVNAIALENGNEKWVPVLMCGIVWRVNVLMVGALAGGPQDQKSVQNGILRQVDNRPDDNDVRAELLWFQEDRIRNLRPKHASEV